jgi:hypothetical protein
MANEIACGQCANYDPIMSAKRKRPSARGWCTKRSEYPHEEAADQSFPPGVDRVGPGELAKPFIVRSLLVIRECALAEPATADAGAAKRRGIVAKTTTNDGKRRLL